MAGIQASSKRKITKAAQEPRRAGDPDTHCSDLLDPSAGDECSDEKQFPFRRSIDSPAVPRVDPIILPNILHSSVSPRHTGGGSIEREHLATIKCNLQMRLLGCRSGLNKSLLTAARLVRLLKSEVQESRIDGFRKWIRCLLDDELPSLTTLRERMTPPRA